MAQMVNNLSAIQETRVRSLGQEDSLEKGMATHSNILACRIPWTEKSGRLQPLESQSLGHDWATNAHTTREDHLDSLFSGHQSSKRRQSNRLMFSQLEWESFWQYQVSWHHRQGWALFLPWHHQNSRAHMLLCQVTNITSNKNQERFLE